MSVRGAICLLGLGASLLVAAGCGSSSSAQARPDLRVLGLRLSDLPAQTTVDSTRYWSNAQAAHRDGVPVTAYNQHGRVLSYQDSFTRNVLNGSDSIWLLLANSEITAYKTVAGARWYYDRLRSEMQKEYVPSTNNLGANAGQTGIHVSFHGLAIPPLGDAHAAFTADSGGDEMAFTTRVILFRRGPYVVSLRVRGLVDQTLVSKVVAVGRKVDARVRSGG